MNTKVCSQVRSFYSKRQGISHRDQVDFIITDDVFLKRMELVQSERDRNLTLQQKDFLQSVNGNIVWGKTNADKITVIIASKVFRYDDFTWRGTIHHEYIHAHDFWDLADYLAISNMDDIYDYQYYAPFDWWTEYHARVAGSSNVYQHEYAHNSFASTINVCNTMFEHICKGLMQVSSVYDAMQWFGRYSSLKVMYPLAMPALQTGNKKYGLPNSIIKVGEFLHSHREFALICDKLEELQLLVNAV